jgi:hypothetical protein
VRHDCLVQGLPTSVRTEQDKEPFLKHELFTAPIVANLEGNITRALPRSTLPLHDVAGSTLPDMIVEYGQTDLRQLDQLCQIARKKLDFRTLGYPQNGVAFSPPILGVEFRCCFAASRPRSHTLEGEPERMRFAGRADSIGRIYQDDSERSSRRKANEAETGWSQPAHKLQTRPPAKVLAARISMSHLVPLLEFNLLYFPPPRIGAKVKLVDVAPLDLKPKPGVLAGGDAAGAQPAGEGGRGRGDSRDRLHSSMPGQQTLNNHQHRLNPR